MKRCFLYLKALAKALLGNVRPENVLKFAVQLVILIIKLSMVRSTISKDLVSIFYLKTTVEAALVITVLKYRTFLAVRVV